MTEKEKRRMNREGQARWRVKHPNAMKEYYAENREFMLKKMKIAYLENIEERRAYQREYARRKRKNERDNPR